MDYADLREGIRDHLCSYVAGITTTDSPPRCKVWWEWTAPADEEKPFLEMAFLGELPSPNKCGLFMQLEILVIGNASNILALDPIADDVVSCLHHQPVLCPSGRITEPCYDRNSRIDGWSEELNASIIRLKFLIPTDFWT